MCVIYLCLLNAKLNSVATVLIYGAALYVVLLAAADTSPVMQSLITLIPCTSFLWKYALKEFGIILEITMSTGLSGQVTFTSLTTALVPNRCK